MTAQMVTPRIDWPVWTRFALTGHDLDIAVRRLGGDKALDRWRHSLRHRILTGTSFPPLDRPKRWDEANVVELLTFADGNISMLDCGAYNSPAPWAASRLGVRNVAGIDLNPRLPMSPHSHHIDYSCQNMMATAYHDASFDAIVSGSVVEHGVDWRAWLGECRRLIRPGGLLYVSTDVVHEEIDTSGLAAFGLPWNPLRPSEIAGMKDLFAEAGFEAAETPTPVLPDDLPVEFLDVEIGFVGFAVRVA
ncbi:MAG: methyltransferase domain-containing protein [Actinomycetia bacterium]|nr:methyltransferase domain-containing protein [Actinomycetes bacterium]MCP4960984.1 methyltransferase domain-containing protein [Actinomycetes bacterium]